MLKSRAGAGEDNERCLKIMLHVKKEYGPE